MSASGEDIDIEDLVLESTDDKPVTVGRVLAAIEALADLDEAQILELASEDRFQEVFPFEVHEDPDEPLRLPTWEEVAARPEPAFPERSSRSPMRERVGALYSGFVRLVGLGAVNPPSAGEMVIRPDRRGQLLGTENGVVVIKGDAITVTKTQTWRRHQVLAPGTVMVVGEGAEGAPPTLRVTKPPTKKPKLRRREDGAPAPERGH